MGQVTDLVHIPAAAADSQYGDARRPGIAVASAKGKVNAALSLSVPTSEFAVNRRACTTTGRRGCVWPRT
jgi:hypothetical protein